MACTKSSIEVIKTLIEKGASLNRVNKDGWTAFHLAARWEDASTLVEYVILLTRFTIKLMLLWPAIHSHSLVDQPPGQLHQLPGSIPSNVCLVARTMVSVYSRHTLE